MAKAIKAFYGTDTYGRHIERAESVSGLWFWREYAFNGYGKGWTKWAQEAETPTYTTQGTNKITGEEFEYDEPQLFWGWNRMTQYTDTPRFRLPA